MKRYSRRFVKNCLALAVGLGLALPKPPPFGTSSGISFIWLLLAFLVPPSAPIATLIFMLVFTLVATVIASLMIASFFASVKAYNVAYPGGEMWRLIYLGFEVVYAWLFFLPATKFGALGLNLSVNTAGIFMLLVEAALIYPNVGESFNIWWGFTEIIPIACIMMGFTLAIGLFCGYPESAVERLKDAQVDILRTLKRLVVAHVSIQTNEPAPPEVVHAFNPMDEYVAKRRGYPHVGTPFTQESFPNFSQTIFFEVQEVLRQRRNANIEFFTWAHDDPKLAMDITEDVLGLLESIRSLAASAQRFLQHLH